MLPNPFYQSVYFDSCAFDGGDEAEQHASIEVMELFEKNEGRINLVHSVKKEIDFSKTPQWVKDIANGTIHTIKVQLTPQEERELRDIESILVGSGNLEKRKADCMHVFEAQKYGRYFVTTDKDILKHRDAIKRRFGTLFIIRPTEFLEIVKQYINV